MIGHRFLLLSMCSLCISVISGFSAKVKPYCLNLRCSIKPDRREEFISKLKEQQQKTLEESESLQYVIGEETESTNTFYIHEQYLGREGYDAHCNMPHVAEWERYKQSNAFIEGGEPIVQCFYGEQEPVKTPVRSAYCVAVELYIKPDVIEEFTQVIEGNSRGSNNDEPLCLQYVYGKSTTDSNLFIFHEEYTGGNDGKDGFDAHASTPHFKVWEEFAAKEPFTKDPVVHFFKSLL